MNVRATALAPTDAEVLDRAVRDGLVEPSRARSAVAKHADAGCAMRALIAAGELNERRLGEVRRAMESSASQPPRIGPYDIRDTLGSGGMGMVYRVVDDLGEELAVKILSPAFAGDAVFRARFAVETRALLAVTSPYVVAIRGVGEDDGRPYLAMELMRGGSAAELADRSGGKLDPMLAARICRDAAHGLESLHAAGLIHRDIKPENIFLDADGLAKLGDLGVAREAIVGEERLTMAGTTVGTPAFMAPEQARTADVDIRADIYALGATLYCLLVGRPAFTGSSPWLVMLQAMEKPLPDPGLARPGCPDGLRAVVMRAGAVDRNARYAHPRAMREDLDRFLAGVTGAQIPAAAATAGAAAEHPARRLLLVDDDQLILRLHRAALMARGYIIETATSGQQALEQLTGARFDAVLIDLMMEGMDGAEAIRRMRADQRFARLTIIVLSNAFFEEELREAREAGADAILGKAAFSPTQLAEAIERLLGDASSTVVMSAVVPLPAPGRELDEAIARARDGLAKAAQSARIEEADLSGLAPLLRSASVLAAGTRAYAAALLASLEALVRQLTAWPEHFNRSARLTLTSAGAVLARAAQDDPRFPTADPVVVVDDDPISRSVMRMSLRRVGLGVEAFGDAGSALTWLADHRAALVLSDVLMEGMNGIEFVAEARKRTGARGVPIILVTSLSGFDAIVAKGGAVDDVIAKPFLPLELGAKALAAIATPHG